MGLHPNAGLAAAFLVMLLAGAASLALARRSMIRKGVGASRGYPPDPIVAASSPECPKSVCKFRTATSRAKSGIVEPP